MHPDPRDSGPPLIKAWEEFRATFASFRLLAFLIDELEEVAPGYFENLQERFDYGELNAAALAEDDPEYDGAWPVQGYQDQGVNFIDREYARELYAQLFPHAEPASDVGYWSRGAVVIGFHAALEAYAKALGAEMRRRSLVVAVRDLLRTSRRPTDLDPDTADALVDLDQTRILLVHSRGVVTDQYVDKVKDNRFQRGERRELSRRIVEGFASTAWRVAASLRGAYDA